MFGDDFFQQEQAKEETERGAAKRIPPPRSRQEWSSRNGMSQWPSDRELTSDGSTNPLDLLEPGEPADSLAVLGKISDDLRQHSSWDETFLDDVSRRLASLETTLSQLYDSFVPDPVEESIAGGLNEIQNKSKALKYCNPDLLREIQKPLTAKHKVSVEDGGGKTIEQAAYFGCPGGAAPLLPGKIEALPILDLVTKIQQYSRGFLKHWKKFFFCDATCTLFQCSFWWIWMAKYKKNVEEQAALFNLMAEAFAELAMSTEHSKRDTLFQNYPCCMSQALFSAYCQAFPRSNQSLYDPAFLNDLCNYVYEWTTGLPAPWQCWEDWPMSELDPSYVDSQKKKTPPDATLADMNLHSSHSHVKFNVDAVRPSRTRSTDSRTQEKKDESPGIGPGPTFECVRFGTTYRSPLLQHHFWVHGLSEAGQPHGPRMNRTQIKDLPPPTMTYDKLLDATATLADKRNQVFEREITNCQQQINAMIAENVEARRGIARSTKELLTKRYETAVEADKIMTRYSQLPNAVTKSLSCEPSNRE